ncbi:RadC family protein [Paenibacillus solani]|uniref:DNA repair protein RadC n=1 Tax=Paenibacillus solani TaxID=1705565 RepID=A0A0M1P834_9BACL|nr:DNA repair protein RadC [Paenibacillus solani]KOR90567.1 DNA repair protein RadC [Paenibacillus solani]
MNLQHNENLKSLMSQSLREQQDSYTIQQLFEQFPTTTELLDVSEQQLTTIKGIGISKARQITAMLKLAKALTIPTDEPYIIRSPKDVYSLLSQELCHLTKEHFVCLFLNTKNRLITKEIISIGSLNAAIVHPREVFRAAIKRASASLICAHNHPSGDSTPSPEDVELTKRLVDAGAIVGIEVLDHIIIGAGNFVSLKERGLM